MSVAVAYEVSPIGHAALLEAVKEASKRQVGLEVIHVVDTLDLDIAEANRSGLADAVEGALAEVGASDVQWNLRVRAADVAVPEAVLAAATEADAELLVIGARRRSPVGKFLLGSVTQTLILDAEIPVLVVKSRA